MRKTTAGARLLHQQLLLVRSRAATEASNFFTQMHQLHTVPTTTTNLTALFSSLPPPPAESHSQLGASSIVTMSRDSILDPIFDKKRALRTQVRKQLNAIIPTQRTEQDVAIQDVVLESLWFKSSERLCAYISCGALREVDTSKILSEVLHDQGKEDHAHIRKKLYVPRVDDKNNYMSMLNISSTEDLIANSMIILEPSSVDCDGNQREDGLAFDRSGRRLGRSGGYYDMFLRKYQELSAEKNKWKPPLLVALAYDLQVLGDGLIPITHIDVPVDALVSPSGVIPISPAAI